MEERLWSRISALGWNGTPINEACLNIVFQYACGAFDLEILRPFFDEDGSPCGNRGDDAYDPALRSVAALLDEAERLGRLDELARPSIKTPEQIVDLLGRRFGHRE